MNKKSETDTIKKVAKKTKSDTNKRVTKKTETDTNKRVTKKTETNTNKDINKKVETVRRFFSDSKASNHPVKEHPISKTDEYIRNMYFDMLCVAAQYESDDTENAFTLIKRIMSACKNVQPFEEYIRRSMELTVGKTAEFIKQCRDNKLCEIFFVDSLLISCSNGTPNAKQIAFLAQYGDMLGFKKAEMTEISEFAAAILKQDSDGYQKILNGNNAYIQEAVLCYTREFVSGLLICTSKKRYYYAPKLIETMLCDEEIVIENVDEIIIENLAFKNNTIEIYNAKKLKIINCMFYDYSNMENNKYYRINAIFMDNINEVYFEKCSFKNCICKGKDTAIIHGYYLQKLYISDCKFNNISNPVGYYDSCTSGGVIYLCCTDNKLKNIHTDVTINNSEFNDCSVGGHDCGTIIYKRGYPVVRIYNSYFSNCRGYYLFADYSFNLEKDENNQYINCCVKKRG